MKSIRSVVHHPLATALAITLLGSAYAPLAAAQSVAPKTPIYGVTLDDLSHFNQTLTSLQKLPYRPTVRVVFDPGTSPRYYYRKLLKLHRVAYVMGEVLDSSYFPTTLSAYKKRTRRLVRKLGSVVDVWEIANEINGEWLRANPNGSNATVNAEETTIGKMVAAADHIVKNAGGRTAITLYYNNDSKGNNCWEKTQDNWKTWPKNFLPAGVRLDTDYAFFSYYGYKDCPGLNPSWGSDFQALEALFPNAKVGFGEIGTSSTSAPWSVQSNLITTYYPMVDTLSDPKFVGGDFWWYYAEEMVPYTSKYWQLLDQTLQPLPAPQ